MKHVKKSVLLWYSPHEMYALVTDVAAYPQFLPWCEQADILDQDAQGMTARLTLSIAGLRHGFTTRNEHRGDEFVGVRLVDGPFSLLDGTWKFAPVGRGSAQADEDTRACRIDFELRYAFASLALETIVSPAFDRIANSLVDSFVQRAEQVHGPR